MNWTAICENPLLRDLPFKIQTERWGNIVMSPASNEHGIYQAKIVALLSRMTEKGAVISDTNHKVEYWLPFGIGWVQGGNHSIMTGIVKGQGTIKTEKVYDLSELFDHVRFDGNAFIRVSDNTVIQEVSDFEFAAIFEAGRLMNEYGISA